VNDHQIVEAVLFASDAPLTADEIARADESLDEDRVEEAVRFLQAEYDDAERSIEIVMLAEGFQVLTRPEFAPYLERFDNVPRPSRLSGPALETLAIIAYRQPLGRIEMEYIRGVGSAGVLRTLQDREMIEVVGRGEGLGRPVLYGTSLRFLEHFGFRSLEDLPRPEELPVILRDRLPLGPEDDAEAVEAPGDQLSLGEGTLEATVPSDSGGEGDLETGVEEELEDTSEDRSTAVEASGEAPPQDTDHSATEHVSETVEEPPVGEEAGEGEWTASPEPRPE
jgi:segregation and condensation protein B